MFANSVFLNPGKDIYGHVGMFMSSRYSLNSRCHFSNCILAVLATLLGSSLAIFSSRSV